ncbi:MAG TPA: alpha-hydroxy-acid oxidizing protein [Kribbella sp.]
MCWVGTRDKLLARAELGDQVEVLLDGGIRRGGDVVKALALGRG